MYYLWLVVVPNLSIFFTALVTLGISGSIIGGLAYLFMVSESYSDQSLERAHNFGKKICLLCSISIGLLLITVFIPSKADMIRLKVISAVSDLKGYEKIPQKLVDKLNRILDGK